MGFHLSWSCPLLLPFHSNLQPHPLLQPYPPSAWSFLGSQLPWIYRYCYNLPDSPPWSIILIFSTICCFPHHVSSPTSKLLPKKSHDLVQEKLHKLVDPRASIQSCTVCGLYKVTHWGGKLRTELHLLTNSCAVAQSCVNWSDDDDDDDDCLKVPPSLQAKCHKEHICLKKSVPRVFINQLCDPGCALLPSIFSSSKPNLPTSQLYWCIILIPYKVTFFIS